MIQRSMQRDGLVHQMKVTKNGSKPKGFVDREVVVILVPATDDQPAVRKLALLSLKEQEDAAVELVKINGTMREANLAEIEEFYNQFIAETIGVEYGRVASFRLPPPWGEVPKVSKDKKAVHVP